MKLNELLRRIELYVGTALLASIVCVFAANIFMRYVLNRPIPWSEELSNLQFIWFGFLGGAYSIATRSSVRFSALIDRLSEERREVVEAIVSALLLLFLLILIVPSITVISFLTTPTAALRVPVFVFYSIVPISLLLMAMHALFNLAETVTRWRR